MEGRKKTGSSSSSFTSELFRSKESSTSYGIFGAIYAPSSKDLYYSPVFKIIFLKNFDGFFLLFSSIVLLGFDFLSLHPFVLLFYWVLMGFSYCSENFDGFVISVLTETSSKRNNNTNRPEAPQ